MDLWWYAARGYPFGPLGALALGRLLRKDLISSDTPVWQEGIAARQRITASA
jgi:hypothetical protein